LVNSPVTSICWWPLNRKRLGVSVIGKKPLDFIMKQFHVAMDELLAYERDNSFVPSKDQLVLFARLHAQLRQFALTLHVLNRKMRDRAKGIG
jgi:hypothetical protein